MKSTPGTMYANAVLRDFFAGGLEQPQGEAERLNREAVINILSGLPAEDAQVLKTVFSGEGDEMPPLKVAIRRTAYDLGRYEKDCWQLIRSATKRFCRIRKL